MGSVPAGKVASKFGYRKTAVMASAPIILFYYGLRSFESIGMVYLTGVVGGIGFVVYWMGMNSEIAKDSHQEKKETEVGIINSLPSVAGVLAPTVGGIIIALTNFGVLLITVILLMLISFLPFLSTKEYTEGFEISFLEYLSIEKAVDFSVFYLKGFVYLGEKVMWPLYLAVVIGASTDIGLAGSLFGLASAGVSYLAGKSMDPSNKRGYLIGSAAATSLFFVLMTLVSTSLQAFAIATIFGMSFSVLNIGIFSSIIERSSESDRIEYFSLREIGLNLGRVSALVLVAILVMNFQLAYGFFLLGLVTLLTGFVATKLV